MKVLSVFGTRPEAIKMAPLVRALGQAPEIDSLVCITGQHREMLAQVMTLFEIEADFDLNVMTQNQTLNGLCGRLFSELDPVLVKANPDCVLVHGDTSSAMIAALAAFHRQIPVAHVEAGLRTGDLSQPWPEEMNRRAIDLISTWLFAPTATAKRLLEEEQVAGQTIVTGNTVIDALRFTVGRIEQDEQLRAKLDAAFPFLASGRRILLVTGHRRENFGEGFAQICDALAELARRDDIEIVYPVHLNPNVRGPVMTALGGLPNVHLIAPQDYLHFVRLMQLAHVILTDSGGVQEEAPSLGKPVLVMRDVTERPEAVIAGTVKLIGTERERIVAAVSAFFDDPDRWRQFAKTTNPYGDGLASSRIVATLLGRQCEEFVAPTFSVAKGDQLLNSRSLLQA